MLPIFHIGFTTPDKEREQLLDTSKLYYEHYQSRGDITPILEFVENQLSRAPKHTDSIHDLLVFLAEQMIVMNKAKQKEITDFLNWLENHIGAKISDLSNKAKIQLYHESNFDTLLSILRKNRRKLNIDPTAIAIQQQFQIKFDESIATLTPLKAKISATDDLINWIVYKLYGLTEEEIRIVEGEENEEL